MAVAKQGLTKRGEPWVSRLSHLVDADETNERTKIGVSCVLTEEARVSSLGMTMTMCAHKLCAVMSMVANCKHLSVRRIKRTRLFTFTSYSPSNTVVALEFYLSVASNNTAPAHLLLLSYDLEKEYLGERSDI